ncbi:MAG: hypothetical protein KJ050_10650 [Candidatus Omnitrophica bacterium]|nr:hypothetical protein [Candidatus Omnitrophota bacterium]
MSLADSVESMRTAAAATMLDECLLGKAASSGGLEPGHLSISWEPAISKCGVSVSAPREAGGGSQTDIGLVLVRFPYSLDLTDVTHIRLITRTGTALAEPEEYALEGTPGFGTTIRFAQAQRVTGGSVR